MTAEPIIYPPVPGIPGDRLAHFWVPGLPKTQGSMKAIISASTGRPIVVRDNPKALREWRKAIGDVARSAIGYAAPREDPVAVALHFVLPRPLAHSGTGRNAGVVKASAPKIPAGKPDIDKLVRAVLDALTIEGRLYRDDAQVVHLVATKHYPDRDYPDTGVEVRVRAWGGQA